MQSRNTGFECKCTWQMNAMSMMSLSGKQLAEKGLARTESSLFQWKLYMTMAVFLPKLMMF